MRWSFEKGEVRLAPLCVDEMTAVLAAELSPARYLHTLGVLQTATVLARLHGADLERVQTAAILHDCAKNLGREELLTRIREHRIPVEAEDFDYPAILHGPVGADMARRRFGVQDEEVLDAIFHHPVGRRSPSLTLQILMAADYCEPTRDFDGVDALRQAVRADLRKGLLEVLRNKVAHLDRTGRRAHSRVYDMIHSLETC